jgi:hypothetical protein
MVRALIVVVGILSLFSPAAPADVINVPADQPTIQAGIDAATPGDEIVVGPGTYLESIDFLGKAITVRSVLDDPAMTIIDGTGSCHVVQCVSGEGPETILEGFTITGANACGPFPDNRGGGMHNSNSSPTVTNCIFQGNAAGLGGGMYNANSSPMVTNCAFVANTATGVPADEYQCIDGGFGSAQGGGIYNCNSNPNLSGCTFGYNTATSGGGIAISESSSATIADCLFVGNSANSGGGIFISLSNPTITDCTFIANTANGGGGIRVYFCGQAITRCTFINNTAGSDGGAMNNYAGPTGIISCNFLANSHVQLCRCQPHGDGLRFPRQRQ